MTGEFERIDLFLQAFREAGGATVGHGVVLGPGDDCALVEVAGTLALTTDALVEHVHFRRDWATPEQIGHKALAVNLSDLASMGAAPTTFTCALGLPPDVDDALLAGLARGLGRLASRAGIVLSGGNLTRASELSLTITAVGRITTRALRRDGARVGDRVLLVGRLGEAAAELALLQVGRPLPRGPSALHEPEPQLAAGHAATRLSTCGIDVSDGLAQDLGHVARGSRVRIRLSYRELPRSDRFAACTTGLDERVRARLLLAGGEDYALVVTAPPDAATTLVTELGAVDIGAVESGDGVVVDGLPAGTELDGHDHFARRSSRSTW